MSLLGVFSAFLIVLLFGSSTALAAEVDVCAETDADALVSEALVRVRAELRAAGFTVNPELCGEEDPELGRVSFASRGVVLEIRATSVASKGTMIQLADLSLANVTAEVVAVRAVEALRAVLIQSLRSGELEDDGISPSLRQFTQFGLVAEEPKSSPSNSSGKGNTSPRESSSPSPAREKEPRGVTALFSLGPTLEIYPEGGGVILGGEARGIISFYGASLGVVGHAGLYPAKVRFGSNSAEATSWAILFRPGVRLPCPPVWECHLGVLAGVYQAKFVVGDSFSGESEVKHQSFSLQGDVMVGRFFSTGFGALVQLSAGTLLDAPILASGQENVELVWGRPYLATSLAIGYRL